MRVWYDACTGKQVRYAASIGQRLKEIGHEFVFTTREHPDTIALAKILKERPVVVGKYSPDSLSSRLQESAQRIIEFLNLFKDNPPDVAIAHQSVELCSTAFNLGIPIILTADTPYAYAVNRLTIPFANTLVLSEALPKCFAKKYCSQRTIYFKGVDEVAWIKNFKSSPISNLKRPFIVIRQIETKAAYAAGRADLSTILEKKLSAIGTVHVINRYNQVGEAYGIKEGFEDSANLVANADLVISYGGTIAREAALQGIPCIAISDMAKTYVNRYVEKKGFPLFITNESNVLKYAEKLIGKRFDVASRLAALENPVDIIVKSINDIKK